MKRQTILLLVVMGAALLLSSGVALAITKQCKPDRKCEGTRKDDTLLGTGSPDRIFGLRGNDDLFGFGEADELRGSRGNDDLDGGPGDQADDTLDGDEGEDDYLFRGEWGEDVIVDQPVVDDSPSTGNEVDFENVTGNLIINLNSDSGPAPEATDGTNTVNWSCPKDQDPNCNPNVIDVADVKSFGNDRVTGNSAANLLRSLEATSGGNPGGADTLSGGDGRDRIESEDVSGTDTLSGEGDDDTINNSDQSGTDTLSGGEGNDLIDNSDDSGTDAVSGEGGDDNIRNFDVSGIDTVSGGEDNDEIGNGDFSGNDAVSGDGGDDTINNFDGSGADTVSGGEGNDVILNQDGDIVDEVTGGNDTVSGGEGDDEIDSIGTPICIDFDCSQSDGGNDTVLGEGGDDTINVQDGLGGDTVDCGEDVGDGDNDTVFFDAPNPETGDPGDIISPNCETQNDSPSPSSPVGDPIFTEDRRTQGGR